MICTVFAAMPAQDAVIPQDSFIIAADKGYVQLLQRGVVPDLTVGDFDSLGFVPQTDALVRHPVRKDDTDMMLAVREGLQRGFTRFLLYGGLGGRLDHTLANIQTLAFLRDHGARGVLYGDGTAVTLLHNESVRLPAKESGTLSVFSFGEKADGVTERGLSFDAQDICVTNAFPIGVSNAFCGKEAEITVRNGTLLLLWEASAAEAVRFI